MESFKKNFKKYWYLVLFILITIGLIIIWFHDGKLYAGGEEGIPFYAPSRMAQVYSSVWYETGTGYAIPVNIPRAPLFFLLRFISFINLSWVYQALTYGFLIFVALFSTYMFLKYLYRNERLSLFASLFYLFNVYSVSQIWNRFLLTNIFAWAYLPLILYFWIVILEEKKVKHIVLFLISSLAFSYAYGMPAMLITVWFPVLILIGYKLFINRKNTNELKSLLIVSGVTIMLWAAFNLWWLYPYAALSTASFSGQSGAQPNLDSLAGVSQFFPTQEILLLRQSYLFGPTSFWHAFYGNIFVYFGSILVFIITILGFVISRKQKYWHYLLIVFIVAWFLCKGTNPPLGMTFYSFLFHTFSFTTALRNSYEKLGIVFLLIYSIFFGAGLKHIFDKNKYVGIILLGLSILLAFPLLNRTVFTNLATSVPVYYKQANDYLNTQAPGRILIAPIIPGDSAQYFWPEGLYSGLEPSEFLFDKPSISKILRTQYFDDAYMNMYRAFVNGGNYDGYLQNMDIKYILVHNDLNTNSTGASTSAQTKSILAQNPNIKLLKHFGKLDIYSYFATSSGLFITNSSTVKTHFKKLSATKYTVTITNAQSPFHLTFNETYNPLWIATIDGKAQKHSIVNQLDNMWEISRTGSYQINIMLKTHS